MRDLFRDRVHAGRLLAAKLAPRYGERTDVIVLALPRGGVPVAAEVSEALDLPLDVFIVRKLGVPGRPELAMGAVATGGVIVLHHELIRALAVPEALVEEVAAGELQELARREREYREGRPPPDVHDRTVIIVDDGIATGASILAATLALRRQQPHSLVVAAPVVARETCERLAQQVDELIYVIAPRPLHSVGLWYADFTQTTDEEVRELLAARAASAASSSEGASRRPLPSHALRGST